MQCKSTEPFIFHALVPAAEQDLMCVQEQGNTCCAQVPEATCAQLLSNKSRFPIIICLNLSNMSSAKVLTAQECNQCHNLSLRGGVAEILGGLCVFTVYWRPQLLLKIGRIFKAEIHE